MNAIRLHQILMKSQKNSLRKLSTSLPHRTWDVTKLQMYKSQRVKPLMQALIKNVIFGSLDDTLEVAITKFKEIKKQYISLDVEPCMIIQISNKGKAEEEWTHIIKPVLDKVENQGLKWMVLVDLQGKKGEDSLCDTNDIVKGKLPVCQWKDYAKKRGIDIIIFKMVISEGWDIPRACMLYQVRDSKSKQLKEQVVGRVRRNPRLLDFETLTERQKELATTAWVWGLKPEEVSGQTEVKLHGGGTAIQLEFQLKTTKLIDLTEKKISIWKGSLLQKMTHWSHQASLNYTKSYPDCQMTCRLYATNMQMRMYHVGGSLWRMPIKSRQTMTTISAIMTKAWLLTKMFRSHRFPVITAMATPPIV